MIELTVIDYCAGGTGGTLARADDDDRSKRFGMAFFTAPLGMGMAITPRAARWPALSYARQFELATAGLRSGAPLPCMLHGEYLSSSQAIYKYAGWSFAG